MREIKIDVRGEFIRKDNKNGGVQGEHNATKLKIDFDESWSGYSKRLIFRDAEGVLCEPIIIYNPIKDALGNTVDLLSYEAYITGEATKVFGWITFTIEGYSEDEEGNISIMLSASDTLQIKEGDTEKKSEPTPSQALQLQKEIEGIIPAVKEICENTEKTFENHKVWENFDESKMYYPGNKVYFGGNSYVNFVQTKGTLPTNENFWQIIAARGKGDKGDKGDRGDRGEKGLNGIAVKESGFVSFEVENDRLYAYCGEGGEDDYYIEDGHLYLKLEERKKKDLGRVTAYSTYGVEIDLTNSNPETSIRYIADAKGMAAGYDAWEKIDIFKDIKPCLLKDGKVVGYLKKDNFAQFEDGGDADITSGEMGNVMIEIPKIGYKITKDGGILSVMITNDPKKEGFCYNAHTRKISGDREKLYIGAYLGSGEGLSSVKGAKVIRSKTLSAFRKYAKSNGAGYDVLSFYPMTLLQCLYLICYKNLNSQEAVGNGIVGSSDYAPHITGCTYNKGMCYGDNLALTEHMKMFGIEDVWGNAYQFIDGFMLSEEGYRGLVAFDNFNDEGAGYTDIGQLCTGNISGVMTQPQGNNDAGFIIKEKGGSSTTYFCDNGVIQGGNCYAIWGGNWNSGSVAGIFRFDARYDKAAGLGSAGARLMYL